MMRVEFHPEATAELESSLEWYLEQSVTAAQRFAVAVEMALERITEFPLRYARIDACHRSCDVDKSPFQIVFREGDERMYVIAIAHAKRRSGYWK